METKHETGGRIFAKAVPTAEMVAKRALDKFLDTASLVSNHEAVNCLVGTHYYICVTLGGTRSWRGKSRSFSSAFR